MKFTHLLSAALVMIGLYLWVGTPLDAQQSAASGDGAAAVEPEAPAVKVVAYRSTAQPVEGTVLMRGRTEAHRSVYLRAETPGLVISDPLRAGARVSEGQVLCRLESGEREARLSEAQARLAQAQADADAANALVERGITAENTAIARRAALQAAQASVRAAEIDMERLTLEAPFDGVLETDAAEIGSLLRVGDECARIIALDPIKLVGFVTEADVDKLEFGQAAFARLVSGKQMAGSISFISRSADETTRTFRVEVTAQNPQGQVRDGLTAEIVVPLAGGAAHLTPQNALTLDDAGRLGVRVVENDRARFIPVDILRETREGLWLSGLPERADIIFVGQEYVADGRAVEATLEDWSDAR
ncbi:MAG: efflux RND transporter periplasmic adaptor subunit [Pseudomonadota bacterium]